MLPTAMSSSAVTLVPSTATTTPVSRATQSIAL